MFEGKGWEKEFTDRLGKYYEELKWLYMELYSNDQKAFDYFCTMLHEAYARRDEKLRARDRVREQNPGWYSGTDMMGMMTYTNCFAGTLRGVEEHLDYIRETGVNYIHLMPLLQSPKGRSDGGYAVSDFRKVEPSLGTMEDLAHLADKCHDIGMDVCLDFVMNHTSEDHEWAVRARRGEKEYMDRYFFFDSWEIPNEFEKTIPQVFPINAPGNFSWCEALGKVVMTTFYPYQWDLNYHNPTVFNDMTDNMLFLCNQGIDIIRLDAVPYNWKTLGTSCRNLPQVHTMVRIMRMASDIVCPGTLLLGEVVMEPRLVVPYFGTVEKPECHMLYNVTTMCTTWHTVATRDVRLLRHQMETVCALPKQYTFLNYLRCHDDLGWGLDYNYLRQFGIDEVAHKKYLNDYFTGRWPGSPSRGELYNDDPRIGDARFCGTTASMCGIETAEQGNDPQKWEQALRLNLMLNAFLMTQTGIPMLYSGDEIAQLNDYSYHDDPDKMLDSRYIHRGNFSWEDAALRGDPATRQGIIFQGIQELLSIRRSCEVFSSEADTWMFDTWNDHVLGMGRYYKGWKMLALFNFDPSAQTAWLDEQEDYYDMLTGVRRPAKAVELPPCGFAWLLTSFEEEDLTGLRARAGIG